MAEHRVVVVGGGLAGLASTMKLAELGVKVDLISLTPVKRSHSVCARAGSTVATIKLASLATTNGSIWTIRCTGVTF